jgi:signal transduction histidine kinase
MAAERKVAVDVATPPDVAVAADGEDVAEMVGNLAENAAKWAARMVCLSAARQGGQILIMVEDDGPGIPKADRDRVLARGVRLDATIPGSGLGLAIAADLAELCGGSIALDASPLGGLAARLTLPAAP